MKKFIFIIIFLTSFNQLSFASFIDNIENERKNCLNGNYESDYTMAQCNYKATDKLNNEIKELLEKLRKTLPKSQYFYLLNSQKQWNYFVEADNFLLEKTLESNLYFEPYLISSSIKYQNQKHRYEELITIYEYLNK